MKLSSNEKDGLLMLIGGLAVALAACYKAAVYPDGPYLWWVLGLLGVAAMFMAAAGVIFLMRRGPERFLAALSHIKKEVWQPMPWTH